MAERAGADAAEASLTLRRARRGDVPAVVRLLADDALGQSREAYADPLPDPYWSAFEAIDRDAAHELVVGERDGEVIACMQLTVLPYLTHQGGRRLQIEAVRVDRRVRGRGLGEALLHHALRRAREEGCHLVQLTTDRSRPDALRFYERLGFRHSHAGMKLSLDL